MNQAESFRGLLLRYRGRSGLTQRQLAERVGVHMRCAQQWEAGINYPTAERLEALIKVLLETGGLSAGHELEEAQALWTAAEREAPHTRAPFDTTWFDRLVGEPVAPTREPKKAPPGGERPQDWGAAPDVLGFVNRTQELAMLRGWILEDRCRLVAVLGLGGIGKTMLTAKVAELVAPSFERVYWRSLRDAPSPSEWLAGATDFLSDQQLSSPAADSEKLRTLLHLLRERRCLLVLDNLETLLEAGDRDGRYRQDLAGYRNLLEALGGAAHQSCVLLTSREAPGELPAMESDAVRTFQLGGLGAEAVQLVLAPKQLVGTPQQWSELTARFDGNPLALKLVGDTIRDLFAGEIGAFLEEAGMAVFGSVRRLLAQQVERSSAVERQVLRMLAVQRAPMRISAIVATLTRRGDSADVLEAVRALRRRSLVERVDAADGAAFRLQSVVQQYVKSEQPAAA